MSEPIVETTNATFDADVLQSATPVLLHFWAPWSDTCKEVEPVLEWVTEQYRGRLRVMKYNIADTEVGCARFEVRAVPTLMALRNGVEVARCTGFSTPALRSVIAAALGRKPAGATSARGGFGGDASRKARCLVRLAKAIDDGLLARPERTHASKGPGHLPSRHAVPVPGANHSTELGVPAALGVLHDHFFEISPADGSDTRFALAWVDAIPVGADLTGMPAAYAQWLLHDPTWGLGRLVPSHGPLRVLWEEVIEHHRQCSVAATPADEGWRLLEARCSDLQDTFDHETNNLEWLICHALESAIFALARTDGYELVDLSGALVELRRSELEVNWWTRAECALIAGQQAAASDGMARHGPMPEVDGNAREVAMKQVVMLINSLQSDFRIAHPEIALRAAKLTERAGEMRIAQKQCLLDLLRGAPPAEG